MQRSTRRIDAPIACLVAWLLASGGAAHADITYGGNARAIAMGGAGLAIVDYSGHTTAVNPAALALYNRRVRVEYPNIGLHADGIPLDKAWDHLISQTSANDAVSLARDFGQRESDFGANLGFGVQIGHMDIMAMGTAVVHVIPNAALEAWAKTANGDVSKLTGAERADALGAAIYSLPQVGAAERISPFGSPIRVDAGVRVSLSRAVYTHYLVDANNIIHNTPATPAPELNGGTTITKDGVSADLGFLLHPAHHSGFSGAVVITDLVEPGFTFNGTGANGVPAHYDLQPRSFSLGSAWQGGRIVVAADAVDLSRAYANTEGRFGAEYTTRRLSLRAGYSTAVGFTAGFGYGWLQFAFGNKAPLTIAEVLRF